MGPLSTEAALVQLLKQVDAAVSNGAKLMMGGKRIDRPGSFMETTILTDIRPDNPAFRDEFFGPVVSFFRVKDEAAAIALANDSDFGLGGSVFTKDDARGKRVASRVDTGMMFINNIDWSDAELPFGGIKDSGYGRELGNMGIQEFVNKKLVRTGRPRCAGLISTAMYVNVAVLTETRAHERRVALVPSVVARLVKLGARLHMQAGPGRQFTG